MNITRRKFLSVTGKAAVLASPASYALAHLPQPYAPERLDYAQKVEVSGGETTMYISTTEDADGKPIWEKYDGGQIDVYNNQIIRAFTTRS